MISALLDFLTFALCAPYSETSEGQQFDMLLEMVASNGRTIFKLFQVWGKIFCTVYADTVWANHCITFLCYRREMHYISKSVWTITAILTYKYLDSDTIFLSVVLLDSTFDVHNYMPVFWREVLTWLGVVKGFFFTKESILQSSTYVVWKSALQS